MLDFGVQNSFHTTLLRLSTNDDILLTVGLWYHGRTDDLLNCCALKSACLLRSANATAKCKVTLTVVLRGGGMRDTQRAINSMAVARLWAVACVSSVTSIAHVVCPKAMEYGNRTTKHALPVNLCLSMSLADVLASANLF